MNICFYTSEQPSAESLLNINHLVQNRPAHNYSFLEVIKKQAPKNSLTSKLKKIYGELRFDDGRFDFQRDSLTVSNRIREVVPRLNLAQFNKACANEVNDDKSAAFLKNTKPDLIIQAGAGILKQNIFSLANIATINLHHGISPEIRGIDSTFWCLFFGIKDKIGVSCHFIDETLDTGAIIIQKNLITNSRSFIDIQFENYLLGREVLLNSVDILDKGGYKVKTLGEVKSYYFGIVNPFFYYALKKRNFEPLMKISDKAYKMKEKKYLEL